MTALRPPAPRPCESCPYRRDVPAGVWDATEYAKLPLYDADTAGQPAALFACHQQDGRVCGGWAGCHDLDHALSVRLAAAMGDLAAADVDALLDYESPVPLFASGADAAAHGLSGVDDPDGAAQTLITKLARRRGGSSTTTEGGTPHG